MAITAAGIGSGLNIAELVSGLVAAEGGPAENRLVRKELGIQSNLSAYGNLSSALAQFRETAQALQNESDFMRRRAVSSNTDLFTATADKNAVSGTYGIQVDQLAQASRVRTDGFNSGSEIVGTGSLEINVGANSFNLTIDETNNTLAGIRDAINTAEGNLGVAATIINVDGGSRLILSSSTTGAGNDISITATDDDLGDGFDLTRLQNLTTTQAAQDAIFFVDGQQVTRSSNAISDVIDGITFDLKKADPDTVGTLTISQDNNATKSRVEAFVEAYNTLNDTMKQLSKFNAETGDAGPLLGDSVLRSVQNQIRQTISQSVGGFNGDTLAEIGVTTNKDTGGLQLDTARLDTVLAADFSKVANIFASENGVANRLDTLIDRYIGSDGIISNRSSGLQNRLDSIDDDRIRLDARLASLEARYTAQFTAMDILVSQLQGIGDFLTQQLANLPKPNSIGNRNN